MMKKMIIVLLLMLCVFGAERRTLVEFVTNAGCSPCYPHNIYLDYYHHDYEHLFTLIRTHCNWPSTSDPFYHRNDSQAYAIYRTLYGITSVPSSRIDGTTNIPSSTVIEAAQAISTPVTIDLSLNTATNIATAVVTNSSAVSGSNLRIFFVVIEDDLAFAAGNGQTIFHEIMREYFPSTNGTSINLSSPGTQTINQAYDLDLADVDENCAIVCYIQDRGSLSLPVYQSDQEYIADYGFHLFPLTGINMNSANNSFSSTETFTVYNTHTNIDNYTITTTVDVPAGWTFTTTADGTPFTGSTVMSVNGESHKDIVVNFNSNGHPGIGSMDITAEGAEADFTEESNLKIYVGGNVLIVDDDGGASYEDYFIDAVIWAGRNPCCHSVNVNGIPAASFMDDFEAVVWFTGTAYSNVITPNEEAVLQTYLNGGGRLYMNGQEVGYDIGGSDEEAVRPFYTNYLKATFEGDDASYLTCVGISGDPVSNGLAYNISGGDGADNQNYPDYLGTTGGSTNCMYYGSTGSGQVSAIKYDGIYKLVYAGFSHESISTETHRTQVMYRILNWFGVTLSADESPETPKEFFLRTSPNPFNGALKIDVAIGTDIDIYDMHGRFVGKPDFDDIWRPENDISTGVYLVRATNGDEDRTCKVIYMK